MKTNFKKLALMAGVSVAMAGGSMSAHAVIQAVPAPAALIPLFFNGTNGNSSTVRIEVPSSVGVDAVVNLYGGPNTIAGGGIPSSGIATGLAASAPSASTPVTSQLHWYFMDSMSNEMANSAFPVSANDTIEFTSSTMPTTSFCSGGNCAAGPANQIPGYGVDLSSTSTETGYLVIVNESAALGGAPSFSFQADSFSIIGPVTNNIPVIPLTDTADKGAAAPTLANNVLENVAGVPAGAPYGSGPIVSPLMSGLRLGSANARGTPYGWYRVVDFPINARNLPGGEVYAVWTDRNATLNIAGSTIAPSPALTGSTLTYDCNENAISGPGISLARQLSFIPVGATANTFVNNNLYNSTVDNYSFIPQVGLGNTSAGNCNVANSVAPQSGFLRWFIQPSPYNVGGLTNAAYQGGVIFRLRQGNTDGYGQLPVDRGFFTAK